MTHDQASLSISPRAPRITVANLLERIDAFVARCADMTETRLGREVNGERALVASIRNGRVPSLVLTNKILDYIDEQDAANSGQGGAPSPDSDAPTIDPCSCRPPAPAVAEAGEIA